MDTGYDFSKINISTRSSESLLLIAVHSFQTGRQFPGEMHVVQAWLAIE